MKKFISGLVLGVVLTVVAGIYFLQPFSKASIDIGRLLNKDVVVLEKGLFLKGWILHQDDDLILMETVDGSSMTIPVENCRFVKKNVLMKYVWEMK